MSPARKAAFDLSLEILVEAGDWPKKPALRRIAARVLGAAAGALERPLPTEAELSILFTDDARIRELNGAFRKADKPTNVLSFPAPPLKNGGIPPILGDIVLAFETVSGEARAGGLTLEDHLAHLILHGFLHILGYDHVLDAEADAMERLETAILGGIGIADPYSP